MATKDLEARLQILEDVKAIENLKARYCYLMDASHKDPGKMKEVLRLFAKDAKVKFQNVGSGEGGVGVETFFTKRFLEYFSFTMHMIHSPLIEINGNEATGRWYLQTASTVRSTNQARWAAATYHDTFVKEDGVWKFKSIETRLFYSTLGNETWANKT